MYASGAPIRGHHPADRAGPARVRIDAVARQTFPQAPAVVRRPGHREHLRTYLSDLVRPYEFPLREEALSDGTGHSYGEMTSAIIGELAAPDQPLDLVVLAFAVPDIRPGRATATYLGQLCRGDPLAFAICDQGGAAAFTGLRLVREYAAGGGCQRALLLVVEQAALGYDTGPAAGAPASHTAVGLRCDRTGPAEVTSVRQHADVPPERVGALLTDEVTEATAGHDDPLVIVEPHLASEIDSRKLSCRVRAAPAGHLHTGSWWELAGVLADRPAGQRVVLATYDRQLRYLCLSTIDVEPDQ